MQQEQDGQAEAPDEEGSFSGAEEVVSREELMKQKHMKREERFLAALATYED